MCVHSVWVESPANAKVINLTEKTVMPGLVDVHAHYRHQPSMGLNKMSALNVIEQRVAAMSAYLAYGVTTFYEVAGRNIKDFWLSDMVQSGAVAGPRIYSVGTLMLGTREMYAKGYKSLNSWQDILEHVHLNKAHGATALKDYITPSRKARQQLAVAARAERMNLVIEPGISGPTNMTRLIDGATDIAHGT